MDTSYRKHYGLHAASRSLGHFVLGKTFRMVSSLALMLVLVRVLPTEQYAIYISFQALVAALDVITSIGIKKVLFRFLPELRATGNHIAAYRLLLFGMLARSSVVFIFFVALLPLVPWIGSLFNIGDWTWLLPWYLVVGYLRLSAAWLSECLESFLWQRESQYSMAVGGTVMAGGVVLMALLEHLSLENVVIVTGIGEAISLTLLTKAWIQKWRADEQHSVGDTNWWGKNRSRAVRFGFWSYLLAQSSLLYGSAPNRLIVAHALPVHDLAILGVADNFMNLARRWVPSYMLMSMVRPIAMARYAAIGNIQEVVKILDFVFRVNTLLLLLPIVVLGVLGPQLLDWITAGKYASAGYLLLGFLVVLAFNGLRDLLELMVQALEKNSILFWTNLFQSASLFLAVPLLPLIGVWSLVVSNLIGTTVANSIVIARLNRQGHAFSVSFGLMSVVAAYGAITAIIGTGILNWTGSVGLSLGSMITVYALLNLAKPPLNDMEKKILTELLSKKFGKKKQVVSKGETSPSSLAPRSVD